MGALFLYAGALAFFSGVALYSIRDLGLALPTLLAGLGAALICAELVTGKKLHALVFFAILASISLGMVRVALFDDALAGEISSLVAGTVSLEGEVGRDPERRERALHAIIEVRSLQGREARGRVLAVLDRSADVAFGERVALSGELEEPASFETESGRVFDYPSYLRKEGIVMILRVRAHEVLEPAGFSLRGALYDLKHAFEDSIARLFAEPRAGLLQGILLGNRDALPEGVKRDFVAAGLIHIVVLSGYNMTLVAETLMRGFSFLPRLATLSIGATGILAFAVMVGAEATVVRAAVMALLVILARALRRPQALLRGLIIAAFLMVLHDPLILLFDPSFILSFLATFGLITLAPILEGKLLFMPERLGLRAIAAATLATQALVLPALLYMTGNLSLLSLPANLLALVAVPWAMLFGFCSALVGILSFSLSLPLTVLASMLLSYIAGMAQAVGSIPGSSLTIPPFPLALVLLAYAAIVPLALFAFLGTKKPGPTKARASSGRVSSPSHHRSASASPTN